MEFHNQDITKESSSSQVARVSLLRTDSQQVAKLPFSFEKRADELRPLQVIFPAWRFCNSPPEPMLPNPANGVSVVLLEAVRSGTIAGSEIDAISGGGRITLREEERSQMETQQRRLKTEKKDEGLISEGPRTRALIPC